MKWTEDSPSNKSLYKKEKKRIQVDGCKITKRTSSRTRKWTRLTTDTPTCYSDEADVD